MSRIVKTDVFVYGRKNGISNKNRVCCVKVFVLGADLVSFGLVLVGSKHWLVLVWLVIVVSRGFAVFACNCCLCLVLVVTGFCIV